MSKQPTVRDVYAAMTKLEQRVRALKQGLKALDALVAALEHLADAACATREVLEPFVADAVQPKPPPPVKVVVPPPRPVKVSPPMVPPRPREVPPGGIPVPAGTLDPVFGAWVKRRRLALGLSQQSLADQHGFAQSAVSMIELARPGQRVSPGLARVAAKLKEVLS